MASSSKSSTCDAVRSFGGSEVGQAFRGRGALSERPLCGRKERRDGRPRESKSSLFVGPRFVRERQLRENGEDGGTATSHFPRGRTSFCESCEDSQFRKNSSSLSLDEGNLFTFGISTFPWGRGGAREGKGRSRQDERHNVQNEARCDPAEARSPRGDARDAPEVSISGTLCSPLTLSPAIAPATGVTHSGAPGGAAAVNSSDATTVRLARCGLVAKWPVGTQSAISNSETS